MKKSITKTTMSKYITDYYDKKTIKKLTIRRNRKTGKTIIKNYID